MTTYVGASAIVTGAGSGIGLALSRALIARGAHVWLTDINETAVTAAAEKLGPAAHPAALDVRDSAAVQALVRRVVAGHNGLDFLFNNAGIGISGEMHRLSIEHFDRIIDVNLRGVLNGIAAAYPLMVKQGHGHIVNTASGAGLLPMPLMTPYSMTKHAVVGLSTSLRLEAENYGVRVSVLCPSAVETPILDRDGPEDLPKTWGPNVRRYLTKLGGPPYAVDAFADYALDGIEANRGIIIAPASARMAVLLNRIAPKLVLQRVRKALKAELAERPSV